MIRFLLVTLLPIVALISGVHPAVTAASPGEVPRLGPVPANCPRGPKPRAFHRADFGTGVGSGPVYAAGFSGSTTVIHLSHMPYTPHGWQYKLLWAMPPHTTSAVTLRGWNLDTGKRVWFLVDTDKVTPTGVLQPAGLKGSTPDGWIGFPSEEYIPSAGCYVLVAQWKNGGWAVPFAAGRGSQAS